MIKNQKGQVVVLLLLVMVIALAVGLSTINRSTLEVSTSRKSEDSSRAFSAAEAGMEKIIQANVNNLGGTTQNTVTPFSLGNQSSAVITTAGLPNSGQGLAYPPFGKESFAQFWLVNPSNVTSPDYTASSFYIYFGTPETTPASLYTPSPKDQDKPAIEVSTIYWNGSAYMTFSKYFDSYSSSFPRSGFGSCDTTASLTIDTNNTVPVSFYCRVTVSTLPTSAPIGSFPVMVRIRILYSNLSHPVAIKGVTETGKNSNIPKQANIYTSSGTSGSVQRTLEVFNQKSVMPQFFDYVLFSASELTK